MSKGKRTEAAGQQPLQWRYQRLRDVADAGLDDVLAGVGNSGWELVYARKDPRGRTPPFSPTWELLFKKPG